MTTPQIIPIISGDLLLFSKAIRKQQWANFGKALLKNEAENLKKTQVYNDLVTVMEGQYLQKVMKSERRVHLRTLLEKTTVYSTTIGLKRKNDDAPTDIRKYYNTIFAQFGIRNSSQVEVYSSFMLSLPLRTQIQFLLLFEPTIKNKTESDDKSVKNSSPEFEIKNVEITDPFLSELFEKEVDVDLAKNMPKMLNVVILKLLLKERMLSEAYQLQPTTSDLSLNSSLTALNLLFSQQVKNNPHLIFDYFIKIGYTRNLLSTLNYEEKDDKKTSAAMRPSVERLCKHAEIYQDKVLRDIVGNMTAYIRGSLNFNSKSKENLKSWGGTIPLYGLASKAKKSDVDTENRIDSVFPANNWLAYIPLSISEYIHKNTTILSYSFYTLLATIGQLIRDKESLKESLNNNSQLRSYVIPNFERAITESDEESLEDEITSSTKNDPEKLSTIIMLIKDWIGANEEISISPQSLGKISTRFYYAMSSIDTTDISTLGESMSRRIVAFFNSILIEDVRENLQDVSSLNLNNVVSEDDVFFNNLAILDDETKKLKLKFSTWMLSCPLLLVYVDEEVLQKLKPYIGDKTFEDAKKNTIYHNLLKVDLNIPGKNRDKSPSTNSEIKTNLGAKHLDRDYIKITNVIEHDVLMDERKNIDVTNILKQHFKGVKLNIIENIRTKIKTNPERYPKW